MRRLARLLLALAAASPPALATPDARTAAREAAADAADPPAAHPEVLIVVNSSSPVSVAIGEYYRRARQVPGSHVLGLPIPTRDPTLATYDGEVTTREFFVKGIRDPIAAFLTEKELRAEVRILVLAKGIPLRIAGPTVPVQTLLRDTRVASVDAELALLFSGRDGAPGVAGMANPYYDSSQDFAAFRADHPDAPLRYVVARLDGRALPLDAGTGVPLDVKGLVDRAQAPPRPGLWLVDTDPTQRPGLGAGNRVMLQPAAAVLAALGREVRLDATPAFVSNARGLAGYASWGSNDNGDAGPPYYGSIRGKLYPGTFVPRALAIDLVSTSARTFAMKPADYEQSLAADLVHLGASGVAGNVFEPTLGGCARAPILFRRYVEGVPAGEAFARSVPYLGWMNVWIGDPLMTIGKPAPAQPADLDGDGVADADDDCVEVPDPAQRDTDGDGIGNACDPDFDGDGVVSTSWGVVPPAGTAGDYERLLLGWKRGPYDANLDLDGDGKVDETDAGLAQLWLLLPPGPRGTRAVKSGRPEGAR